MKLVLYSKPGCHLCEGLQEKLEALDLWELEIRDITTHPEWFEAFQYEIPVLCRSLEASEGLQEIPLPRLSPRASLAQVARMIQTHLGEGGAE